MYTTKNKKFHKLEIGLASPKQIKDWAERYLPTGEVVGEVTSWETVNYKTLKPEPNGLFCQRIFGPIVDYTCACGKKSNKLQSGFCAKCGVERTTSRVRRYRLGYIRLKQPVVHTLYATHKPSPFSLCLDWSNKRIQAIMYGTEFCNLPANFNIFSSNLDIYQKWFSTISTEYYDKINSSASSFSNFTCPVVKETTKKKLPLVLIKNDKNLKQQNINKFSKNLSKRPTLFLLKDRIDPIFESSETKHYPQNKINPQFYYEEILGQSKKEDGNNQFINSANLNRTEKMGISKYIFGNKVESDKKILSSQTKFRSRVTRQRIENSIPSLDHRIKNSGTVIQGANDINPEWNSGPDQPNQISADNIKSFTKTSDKIKAERIKTKFYQTQTIYPIQKLQLGLHIYGIDYDMTWRQVEDLQDFLIYSWEQPANYEANIPYYNFSKIVDNKLYKEIPIYSQFYPIQTGGLVFQKMLSHFDLINYQRQLRLQYNELKSSIFYIQEKLALLPKNEFASLSPSLSSNTINSNQRLLDKQSHLKNNLSSALQMKQGQKLFLSSAEIKFRQEILQFGKGKSTWEKERQSILKKLNRLKHSEKKCLRRLQYFRDFHKNQMQPAWMVLNYLPVLPPGLRPITSIRGELVVSDINTLYRKLLTRNKRINGATRFGIFDTALSGSWASWCYNLRQLQEAIDMLLKTGSIEAGKTTKSLLESLKGKKGRFRQHLLGKRVDYSGRSVIVVGPNLKIHECGIPKQMAIELFQPFIIQKLRNKGIVFTTTAAKAIIAEQNPIIWDILKEIMKNHPVLLNRAPTLHRLGIQAFLPKLVEGKAILLHPLVCPAFNADFDGDQMAVHIPLSPTARAEALTLLWSRNHLLAPSSGQPLLLPTQDMVLGCYYLTVPTPKLDKNLLLVNADSIDNSSELISVASCITASDGITSHKKENNNKRPFLKNYQKKFLQSNIFYTLINSLLGKNYYKTILTQTSISPKLLLIPTEINSEWNLRPDQLDQSDKPDRQTAINFPEDSSQLVKSETYMSCFNKEKQYDTEIRFFTELDKKFSILSKISELPIKGTFKIFQNIKSYTKTKSSLQIENELTSFSNLKKKVLFFSNFDHVRQAYERGEIKIHTAIWVRWSGVTQNFSNYQNAKLKECPLEQRISIVGQNEMLFNDRYSLNSATKKPQSEIFYYLRTTPGRILFHNFIFNSFINL